MDEGLGSDVWLEVLISLMLIFVFFCVLRHQAQSILSILSNTWRLKISTTVIVWHFYTIQKHRLKNDIKL